jgi:4-amino-4-deoxy-L-arabinose transferase-like glycosyltransferase
VKSAGRTAIVLVVIALGLHLPRLFFDDAFITFRYAANLAAGRGFCYNPPDRVLGVTTPVFTLLLAAAARLGASIETAALLFGVAGHALLCVAVFETASILCGAAPALLAAILCALHPHLAITAVGGMETSLYGALLLLALLAASRGCSLTAGAVAGLALLTRPDAIFILPPVAWLLLSSRRGQGGGPGGLMGRAAISLLAVAAPWQLFAWWYFGSPVPRSIAAKRLIHASAPAEILAEFGRFLRDDITLMVAVPLAVVAIVVAVRSGGLPKGSRIAEDGSRGGRLGIALALFAALYLAAIVFSGISPFPWYVNPVIPPCIVLAVAGLSSIAARTPLRRLGAGSLAAIWLAASASFGAALMMEINREMPGLSADWRAWEGAYEHVAGFLMQASRPGERVYVGEVGVLGFKLPGRRIIDSSGINSPEVYRIRFGRREGDPEWSREVVRRLTPEYVATSIEYLDIRTLAREGWFNALYVNVTPPDIAGEGQVVFRRRPERAP